MGDVLLDPVVVIQRVFFLDRTDHDLVRTRQARLAVEAQLGRDIGLANQQLIHILHAVGRNAIDGDDVFAGLGLDARLCQRRAQRLVVRGSRQDLLQAEEAALVARDLGAQQTHRDAFRAIHLARVDIGVAYAQFGDQFANHIVQVDACLDVGQQLRVFRLEGFPVFPMHILQVEAVAEGAPSLVVDLCPLLLVVDGYLHVREVNRLAQVGLPLGNIGHIQVVALHEDRLFASGVDAHLSVGHLLLLLFLQVEALRCPFAEVVDGLSVGVEVEVASACQRQFHDALTQSIQVDAHAGRLFGLLLLGGLVGLQLVVLLQEGRGGLFRQHEHVDAAHVVIDVVPLGLAVGGVEVAVGGKHQVFAVCAEDRRSGLIPFVGGGILLLRGDVVDVDHAEVVFARPRVGQPFAVGREANRACLGQGALRERSHLLGRYVDQVDPVLPVGIGNLLRVGAPFEAADVGVVVFGQCDSLAAFGRLHIEFGLAGLIGDIGDVFPVGGPLCVALMGSRGASQVFDYALLGRHVEHFATGRNRHALALRRKADSRDV